MTQVTKPAKTVTVSSLSEADKKRVKDTIQEIADSMLRVDSEKDFQKDALDNLCDSLNLDKKIIRKLATTYHKATFGTEQETFNTFEEFYTMIMEK